MSAEEMKGSWMQYLLLPGWALDKFETDIIRVARSLSGMQDRFDQGGHMLLGIHRRNNETQQ
jgi:hypothetical protein